MRIELSKNISKHMPPNHQKPSRVLGMRQLSTTTKPRPTRSPDAKRGRPANQTTAPSRGLVNNKHRLPWKTTPQKGSPKRKNKKQGPQKIIRSWDFRLCFPSRKGHLNQKQTTEVSGRLKSAQKRSSSQGCPRDVFNTTNAKCREFCQPYMTWPKIWGTRKAMCSNSGPYLVDPQIEHHVGGGPKWVLQILPFTHFRSSGLAHNSTPLFKELSDCCVRESLP